VLQGAKGNLLDLLIDVGGLIAFDGAEHVEGPVMEVLLQVQLLICEEINERSLFNVVVLGVDADVLELALGVLQVAELLLLCHVGPHVAHLLSLVARVDVVEGGELGPKEEGEMADLNVAQVEGKDVLVVPDHASEPLVVGPSSKAGDSVDTGDVDEQENETASAL